MTQRINVPPVNVAEKVPQMEAGLAEMPMLRRDPFASLLSNGGFDTDTVWIKDAISSGVPWTISSGTASIGGTQPSASDIYQNITVDAGRSYSFGFQFVSGTSVQVMPRQANIIGLPATTVTVANTYTYAFTAGGSTISPGFRAGASATPNIDNVYLWEADPDDDMPWLRLPYGYRVNKGGLMHPQCQILRSDSSTPVMSHQYTEERRGNQFFIKPNAAPGPATKFEITSYKAV